MRFPAAALAAVFLLTGCAGGRVYDSNIRRVCLCAVKTVRANGYAVKTQEFQESEGTLVAAFSVPDLKQTEMSGSFVKRAGAFVWNAWEHTKLDSGRGKGKRLRIEERVIAKFRASTGGLLGWLDWNNSGHTTVDLTADVTDYGSADWVINRVDRPREYREALFAAMNDCLAGRQVAAMSPRPSGPVVVAAEPMPAKPVREGQLEAPPTHIVTLPASTSPPRVVEPEKLDDSEVRELLVSGRGLYDAGNYIEAVVPLERAAAADPQNAEALGYLGASYHQLGRNGDAVRVYEQYLKLVPGDYRTRDFVEELKGKK